MDFKIFNDAIHGSMPFHPLLVVVTDTPQLQRLRYIKQLGVCYFVYPSATHSRFEHSLGTAFIAGKLFDKIKSKGLPLNITESLWEKRKLCAQIAGLCHDLGHGPFSHFWESFKKKCQEETWTHEEESVRIFDDLLKEKISPNKLFDGVRLHIVKDAFSFYGLLAEEIKLIKDMIMGRKDQNNYLYQVISNKTNEIDVDKWEYITRDSHMLNISVGFDYKRLINYCKIKREAGGDEQICFRDKECNVIMEMFLARGKLHDRSYQHVKVKIIEEMLLDAFVLANKRLNFLGTPVSKLTDHIYQKILYDDFGPDENMMAAKRILSRIECRHLYKYLASHVIENQIPKLEVIKSKLSTIEGIQPYIDHLGMTTILIDMTKGNKTKDLKNVLIYNKLDKKDYYCRIIDWETYEDCLKFNLKNSQRRQIFLLYKGEEDFPDFLMLQVKAKLKEILLDEEAI